MTILLYIAGSKYIYIESPCSGSDLNAVKLARDYHIYIDTKFPIGDNAELIMKANTSKQFGGNGNPISNYTIQYQDLPNQPTKIVRTDSSHAFEHIDIEILTGGKWTQEKNVYDTPLGWV